MHAIQCFGPSHLLGLPTAVEQQTALDLTVLLKQTRLGSPMVPSVPKALAFHAGGAVETV